MKLPICPHRHPVDGESNRFRCSHPLVRAPEDMVSAQICKCCPQRSVLAAPKALFTLPVAFKIGQQPKSIAVVIVSHNYGHFLGAAIESALVQTRRADEIVVVDDASEDSTESVARAFANRGVTYVRINARHSQLARRAGWLATRSEALVFLDADDMLAPDYLASGLKEFTDVKVGVVYSDVEWFGETRGRSSYPDQFNRASLAQMNFLHTGCLVRRDALAISRALDVRNDDTVSLQDWLLWRLVLADGWLARKQRGLYRYRRHGESMTHYHPVLSGNCHDYFALASLAQETVTLFVSLSGRGTLWQGLIEYLSRQSWPHNQIRLILLDTSQNDEFSRRVRSWTAQCDYSDVRHVIASVGATGLADRPRLAASYEVSLAMARIYNRMACELTTDYVWVVEDDILPPDDACERLLRGFDRYTASVSGIYPSRFEQGYVVWRTSGRREVSRGKGVEEIGGNGFGCVVLRSGVVRDTVFTATIDLPAYDVAFYHRLRDTPWRVKADWSVECRHFSGENR